MSYEERVLAYNREIRDNLQLMYDSIESHGQRKKLLKNEAVKAMLDRYGVTTDSGAE